MKKLLIALAAIGSVNAFASNINVQLQNNTACPVSVNGSTVAPGGTGTSWSDAWTVVGSVSVAGNGRSFW